MGYLNKNITPYTGLYFHVSRFHSRYLGAPYLCCLKRAASRAISSSNWISLTPRLSIRNVKTPCENQHLASLRKDGFMHSIRLDSVPPCRHARVLQMALVGEAEPPDFLTPEGILTLEYHSSVVICTTSKVVIYWMYYAGNDRTRMKLPLYFLQPSVEAKTLFGTLTLPF